MRFLLLCLLAATPAFAQVTTNDQALDALKPAESEPAAPAARTPRHKPAPHAAKPAARPVAKVTPPPQVPLAPPPNPVIAPAPFVMPAHPRPNPPPVPVKADAPGDVSPIAGGTRITFGPGVSTLNQATHDAIVVIAGQVKTNPAMTVSVTAWAPGTPDDPSPARTLALERALAARAVLINAGIVSDRVLAVSKGFDGIAAGPPDRVDITVATPKQTPAGSPLPAPAAPVKSKTKPAAKP
jgi:outer membrane protein OmpA-like peptidoglycan-associated protein